MKKVLIATGVLCAVIGLGLGTAALGNGAVDGDEPGMMASPQMIVLSKIAGVTVHTNIPAGSVDWSSVTLNDVDPVGVWADDRGHIAARFAVAELALTPGTATLTFCGDYDTIDGGSFAVDDVVRVK